jgi:hypothetical protein
MQTKEEILKKCTIIKNVVQLPSGQLDRKLYQEVAKSLELIGGKWKGGNIFGFQFQSDPTELLFEIANGEKRNLKKEFQFFATPDDLADYLVELADIKWNNTILEPSAGQGAIIKAIERETSDMIIDYCELMDINRIFLNKIKHAHFIGEDFLKIPKGNMWNKIIANPPFRSDVIHIRKMYECLKSGGRIVSIASKHWQLSKNKTETEFREWLDEVGAEIIDVEPGKFKESGTMVGSVIIIINKK